MIDNKLEHIAFIMDGNSTWAKQKGKDIFAGYLKGMQNLGKVICYVNDLKIPFATCYAFSSENWLRPKKWVDSFMNLAIKFLDSDPVIQKVLDAKIKLKVIGDISKLPQKFQDLIYKYEAETANNSGTLMQLAMSYGARDELVRSIKKIIYKGLDITEETISANLDTAGIPDPDLIIRTSSHQRLSNFMLWQAAYSEFYFSDYLWPDFDKTELFNAIKIFNSRVRTYGR